MNCKTKFKCTWLGMLVILIAGCVSSPYTPDSRTGPPDAEGIVMQQAEGSLASQDWQQALSGYSRYLSHYPRGRYADQALSRIGGIYRQMGETDAAQAFYQRLVTDFPQSSFANGARLAIIELLILNHQPDEAMAQAQQMLTTRLDDETRRRLWQLLTRQFTDAGSLANAAAYAYMLYKSAPELEKDTWADQLQEAISRLDAEDIEKMWDQMDDPMARSYLMYRYATMLVVMENYGEALEILTAFVNTYPDHKFVLDAASMIATLEQRLSYTPRTLGCLLPLSGPYELYGQRALNAVELALSLVSAGEQGTPVKLVIKDSASEESTAVQGVRELAQAGVGAIIGPIVVAPAAAREAQKLNLPMVTMTQKPEITEVGDFIFRHFITPQSQVKALVSYFVNGVGLRDFAVLYPREAYGQTFMTLFFDEAIRQGGRLVGVEAYESNQTDFATTIKKLVGNFYPPPRELQARSRVQLAEDPYYEKRAMNLEHLDDLVPDPVTRLTGLYFQDPDQDRVKGPALGRQREDEGADPIVDFDVLFIPDAPKAAALILPQLAYHDIRDVYLAGTNLWHSPQLIEMAKDYAQNAVMADGFFIESPSPPVRQFVDAYRNIYERDPGTIEAFAFDTARLLISLLMQPNLHFRHTLRDAMLQAFEVDGVTGPLAFAQDGEAIKSLSLLRIKGERFLEIPRQ